MAAYNKFNKWIVHLADDVNLGSDSFFVALFTSSIAPDGTNDDTYNSSSGFTLSSSGCAEVVTGGGYTQGGIQVPGITYTQAAGVGLFDWSGTAPTWTASSGTGFSFRYAILYDATANTAAARYVIGYWDWGSTLTVRNNSTFSVAPSTSIFLVGP